MPLSLIYFSERRFSCYLLIIACLLTGVFYSCQESHAQRQWQSLEVVATAYNSIRSQTDDQPNITAWGDTLKPGMKCIAVSRDLIELGLVHDTPVRIEGLPGIYLVKDKMHRRWQKRIDLYMGIDVKKARAWGKKRVKISWPVKTEAALSK